MLIDIIIFAALAIFLFIKLKGVLGNEYENTATSNNTNKREIREVSQIVEASEMETINNNSEEFIDQSLLAEIQKLSTIIMGFNARSFVGIAKKVFEMMLGSYTNKNEAIIIELASKKISDRLIQSIQESVKNNIKVINILVTIDEAIIKKILINKNIISISIFFNSQQINYTEDAFGNVLDGNKGDINKISEIWEFEKNLLDNNTKWKLVMITNC